MRTDFASDNTAAVCPEAWAALTEANTGFHAAYGTDEITRRASDAIRRFFDFDCDVFFVFNGTAANSLALASLCQSYHSVIAHSLAHVETDECGAPEFFSNGTKLLLGSGESGKLSPESAEALILKRADIHYPKPKVITVTQSTEAGTVYRPDEVRALHLVAKKHGLRLHMDGARFFNALSHLGGSPAEITWKAGVDVLCLGGTKAGLGFSEAVVFFDKTVSAEFGYRCKQAGQLASKMRYLAAPWPSLLASGGVMARAAHANAMAHRLAKGLSAVQGVRLLHPTEANAVFAELPDDAIARLAAKGWSFYRFIGGGARFVCSWQTSPEAVDELVADLSP